MNIFDYMNLVSVYIINKFECKNDIYNSIVFNIKPIRDSYTKNLFYEVSEIVNYKSQIFYLKFPCINNEDFYNAVRQLIIEYFNKSDMLAYTATSNETFKKFSIVTKNCVNLNFILEDEMDEMVFCKFKEYLDFKLKTIVIEDKEEEISDICVKKLEKNTTSSKILL